VVAVTASGLLLLILGTWVISQATVGRGLARLGIAGDPPTPGERD
jgi:hypothetical protein